MKESIAATAFAAIVILLPAHSLAGDDSAVSLGPPPDERQLPLAMHSQMDELPQITVGQENADLYAALTRRGGGVFACLGEAQVAEAARAHRTHSLHITSLRFAGAPEARDVLVAGRQAAVHPGGELIVAARLAGVGTTKVVLEGTFQGKPVPPKIFVTEIVVRRDGRWLEMLYQMTPIGP